MSSACSGVAEGVGGFGAFVVDSETITIASEHRSAGLAERLAMAGADVVFSSHKDMSVAFGNM